MVILVHLLVPKWEAPSHLRSCWRLSAAPWLQLMCRNSSRLLKMINAFISLRLNWIWCFFKAFRSELNHIWRLLFSTQFKGASWCCWGFQVYLCCVFFVVLKGSMLANSKPQQWKISSKLSGKFYRCLLRKKHALIAFFCLFLLDFQEGLSVLKIW